MSSIELNHIPGEDYYTSSADYYCINVVLTHGEQVKFKFKFKTKEEAQDFANTIFFSKNKDGSDTYTKEILKNKVIVKSCSPNSEYSQLDIDMEVSDMRLFRAIKKQYEKQVRGKIDKKEDHAENDDIWTEYTLRNTTF